MKIGDELQIEGRLGFLTDPIMVVKDIKGGLVLLQSKTAGQGGILSDEGSWHGISLIEKRIK